MHRTADLRDVDRRELDGIPVTSAPRSLIDLGAVVGPHALRAALRRAMGAGHVTARLLGLALERYPGRRGVGEVRRAFDFGMAPTKSDRESDVLDIIVAAGLLRPAVNRRLVLGGRPVIPDFRWPVEQLILEVDSTTWHENPLAWADDADRQALLEASGETVLRVHRRDAVLAPSALVGRLLEAGAPIDPERRVTGGAR